MAGTAQFAVLLKEFAGPSAEQLKRAFSSFSHLTDADAVRLAVSARGFLMRQLNRDSARAFQHALAAEGVSAAVVAEEDLPRLPDTRLLRRIELTPEAMVTFDALGRSKPVEWGNIAFIVAGAVRQFEMTKTLVDRKTIGLNPIGGIQPKIVQDVSHKMEWESKLVLEMLLADGTTRYQIEAASFPFRYVIDQPELSTAEKFIWLVREICKHTPQAILNEGARAIRDGQNSVAEYNSKQMMTDETVWLLWNRSQPPAPSGQ